MKRIITRRRFNIVSMFTIVVLLANLLVFNFINKSYANKSPEKYDLRDEIGTIVGDESQNNNKPQGSLKNATLIQLESHIKLGKKMGKYNSYTDEIMSKLSSMESELNYKVKAIFPLYKETTSSGVTYYTNTDGKVATSDELKERRESLKRTIIEYGGVIAYISKSGIKDGLNDIGKVCLSKDIVTAAGDQAVVIIGWDDDFSKDNFKESCRPTTNGAFIVQSFDDVFFVSYEDIYIENNLRYIESVEELEQEPVEEPKHYEEPVEPTEEPTETPTDTPVETPNEEPNETPTEEPVTEPVEQPDVTPEPVKEPEVVNEPVKEPDMPTEVTKVETGDSDALEVDTSSIKDVPQETSKPVTKVATATTTTKQNDSEVEYVSNANIATRKLPQTGSNIELYFVIAIAVVMFIAFVVHSLRNVIGSDKEI
ncbi:MAG: hypothetical protein IKE91_07425 [Clostridia bacterium]|nr:hypothetical protein [Clostridia bacterium]